MVLAHIGGKFSRVDQSYELEKGKVVEGTIEVIYVYCKVKGEKQRILISKINYHK